MVRRIVYKTITKIDHFSPDSAVQSESERIVFLSKVVFSNQRTVESESAESLTIATEANECGDEDKFIDKIPFYPIPSSPDGDPHLEGTHETGKKTLRYRIFLSFR